MKILPVMDVLEHRVVRGIGGRRRDYQPLTPECDPIRVGLSFRERFGLEAFYLADLDAIAGKPPALHLFADLQELGFRLWVDAGVSNAASAETLFRAGIDTVVAGLETVTGPAVLAEMCQGYAGRVVFSVDLREGVPLGNLQTWRGRDTRAVGEEAIAAGVRRILLLDLARVGTGTGTGTGTLAGALIADYPGLEVAVGGGVRDAADLRQLRTMGVHAVLVASALHDGRIRRQDIEECQNGSFVQDG